MTGGLLSAFIDGRQSNRNKFLSYPSDEARMSSSRQVIPRGAGKRPATTGVRQCGGGPGQDCLIIVVTALARQRSMFCAVALD